MTQEETRALNQATVEKYLAKFTNERAALFTEDALCVYPFCADTTEVPGIRGRDKIYETLTHGMKVFNPMEYFDILIFSTQDPNAFWADVKSRGKQTRDGEVIDVYNKYVFFFRLKDGLIEEMREYYNPLLAMKANHCAFEMPNFFTKAPVK
jgi:ketosteroid isomerase-like protein